MPKSFLVKRKCCPHICEEEVKKRILDNAIRESDANGSATSGNSDVMRTSVITHSALAVEQATRTREEKKNETVMKSLTKEYPRIETTQQREYQESPLTYEDFAWLRHLSASRNLVRSLQMQREVEPLMYDYAPQSPSSSVESPLSPASCHSADVPRDEIEQIPLRLHRGKLYAYTQDNLSINPENDSLWRESSCPSPVIPYQPVAANRTERGKRNIAVTDLKPKHTCKDCGKSFMRASSLSNHKLIHRNIKAFHCDKCNMSFLRKSDLGKHIVTHTGIKPYQCDICYKRFSQSSNMLTHRRRHTGTRPFSCRHCGKAFYRKVDVRRHSRIHQ